MLWGGPGDGKELSLPKLQHYLHIPVLYEELWTWKESTSPQDSEMGVAVYRCQKSVAPGVYQYRYQQTVWPTIEEVKNREQP